MRDPKKKMKTKKIENIEERIVDISKKEVSFSDLVFIFAFFFFFHSLVSLDCSYLSVGSGLAQVFIDLKDPFDRLILKKGTIC